MKKFIAAAVLAGLATAAFAQTPAAPAATAPTITWGGYIDTGITAAYNLQDRASVGYWGDDAGKNGGRFKLIGKVAAGDYGFNFELRGQGLGLSNGSTKAIYFDAAYAYANFFNKLVYTQAGIIDQRDSRPAGDAAPSYTKETPGLIVVVRPADGVSVNAFVAPALSSLATSAADNAAVSNNVVSSVGGAYTVPGLVKVVGQVKLQDTKAFYAVSNASDTYAVTDYYVAAGLLSVPNLFAWIEYQNTNLNNGKLQGKQIITETVSYNFKDQGLAPLSAGLISYQSLFGKDTKTNNSADKTELSYRINGWVSYDLGGIVPKFDFNYFAGADTTNTTFYTFDLGKNPASVNGAAANLNKVALVEIKPSVKFVLNPTSSLTFVESYITSVGSEDLLFLGSTNKDATSQLTTQINYTFSF